MNFQMMADRATMFHKWLFVFTFLEAPSRSSWKEVHVVVVCVCALVEKENLYHGFVLSVYWHRRRCGTL